MKCTTLITTCLVVVVMFFIPSPVSCHHHGKGDAENDESLTATIDKMDKQQKALFDKIKKDQSNVNKNLKVLESAVKELQKREVGEQPVIAHMPAYFTCPDNTWTRHRDSCLKSFHDHPMHWIEARNFCQEKGGLLARILDKETNDLILSLIPRSTGDFNDYHFIALNDLRNEGHYQWSRGLAYDPIPLTASSYWNWGRRQPNNWMKIENCGTILSRNGKWHDYNCRHLRGFVCQINEYED